MDIPYCAKDYWRAIILYGRNTSTYKMALATCLFHFAKQNRSEISMEDLSKAFFDTYKARLIHGMPQLNDPHKQTKMEHIVGRYTQGKIHNYQAIHEVQKNAFRDVLPRFHTVNQTMVPTKFYDYNNRSLHLTDSLFTALQDHDDNNLLSEIESRWSLLEAAFQITRKKDRLLVNDLHSFYIANEINWTEITQMLSVLYGYQKGLCFYCGEPLIGEDIAVDHVIPRHYLQHNDVWNLVIAHKHCQEMKRDMLPEIEYIDKLIERNEHLVFSSYPIKRKLMNQLGSTPDSRKRHIYQTYGNAKKHIPHVWHGPKGYNPTMDEFYKSFVRSLLNC